MKRVLMVLLSLLMVAGGILLARYAEADDAPGGVVMGWAIIAGAVALGARAFIGKKPA
jgi:hypothetical protein